MKILYLFTNEFPYGNWEPYLETEIKYYENFDKIYIYALQLRKEHSNTIRKVPLNCNVIPIYYAPKWKYLVNSIRVLADKNLYKELQKLIRRNNLKIRSIIDLFVFFSRANYEARMILKSIKLEEAKKAIFYSYRFEYQPYVTVLLKEKLGLVDNKIIVRAHRYDLYEEYKLSKYIPCREILLKNVDAVYPCSKDGTKYLIEKFPNYKDIIKVEYLGTSNYNELSYLKKGNMLQIVSCSHVVSVKRLNLLVDSLRCITNLEVKWTHFGDGILLNDIKKFSKQLPSNIEVDFRGNVSNKELMKIYQKESFDLFINVSSSEGIPVSIMEAMSFGIPCIATDVGGTREIIENYKNGYLLDVNFKIEELVKIIIEFVKMSEDEYVKYRKNARKSWEEKFNADVNYKNFANYIFKLLEE